MAIHGKVARKVTGAELIVNKGSDHGVEVGMRVHVMDIRTQDVKDPDTGEDLGSIPRVKRTLEVIRVSQKLALCRTARTGVGAISAMFDPSRDVGDYLIDVMVGDPVEVSRDPLEEARRARAAQSQQPES